MKDNTRETRETKDTERMIHDITKKLAFLKGHLHLLTKEETLVFKVSAALPMKQWTPLMEEAIDQVGIALTTRLINGLAKSDIESFIEELIAEGVEKKGPSESEDKEDQAACMDCDSLAKHGVNDGPCDKHYKVTEPGHPLTPPPICSVEIQYFRSSQVGQVGGKEVDFSSWSKAADQALKDGALRRTEPLKPQRVLNVLAAMEQAFDCMDYRSQYDDVVGRLIMSNIQVEGLEEPINITSEWVPFHRLSVVVHGLADGMGL